MKENWLHIVRRKERTGCIVSGGERTGCVVSGRERNTNNEDANCRHTVGCNGMTPGADV